MKLRMGEANPRVLDHTARSQQSQDSDPTLVNSKARAVTPKGRVPRSVQSVCTYFIKAALVPDQHSPQSCHQHLLLLP